jgi:hypothetical protein
MTRGVATLCLWGTWPPKAQCGLQFTPKLLITVLLSHIFFEAKFCNTEKTN